ncbi:Gamma thionin [Cynara cardunculus var. scolymus]|uniref:Gamma thionin n=1 Tax=Cynara cardunculus var. scolymus TaxID=59895 RepID=A0A103YKF0_CYNCS|nr:Gamma thionin [Cynara cardunculus var. scolymus]
MAKNSVAFFAFILILFVLAISEQIYVRRQARHGREGATTQGSGHCDNQCKSLEGAAHGACHDRDNKKMCFCYFNCAKLADQKLGGKLKPNGEEAIKP